MATCVRILMHKLSHLRTGHHFKLLKKRKSCVVVFCCIFCFCFFQENMTRDLGLNDAYQQCKKTAPKEKKPKTQKEVNTSDGKDANSKKKD